jgi:hypothetical protein
LILSLNLSKTSQSHHKHMIQFPLKTNVSLE